MEENPIRIRGLTVEEYLERVRNFHGYLAPGVVSGGFMVELACRRLPEGRLYDAISETGACLPDAIQLLTPCTIGNGWLRVLETGRFALAIYDKETGRGARAALDPGRLSAWPAVKAWALKLQAKSERDEAAILAGILAAETGLYKVEPVTVDKSRLTKMDRIFICPACGESYRAHREGRCGFCSGEVPLYTAADTPDEE